MSDLETHTHAADAETEALAPEGDQRTYIVVRLGQDTRVEQLSPAQPLIVGRESDAGLRLTHASVSRRHVRLFWVEGSLHAEDLGSHNGTTLNGRPLSPGTKLFGGDTLRLGEVELTVATTAAPVRSHGTELTLPGEPNTVVADPAMARVFNVARRLSQVQTSVLICGETGVGKEVVAERIHGWSRRSDGPFVRLNCGALPEALAESALFGHERGAFTGADQKRQGHFEAAQGGTLLLDEIGELPLSIQAKLLLALENGVIVRLGSTRETPVDVRVLCATHRDLLADTRTGRFREDLYYRVAAFTLSVPPLRERKGELRLLAALFCERIARAMGDERMPELDPGALAALEAYSWPGNVRELRNAIEHAMVLAEHGVLRVEHLPPQVTGSAPLPAHTGANLGVDVDSELAVLERSRIEEALRAERGNQTRAAKRLGITRRALLYRLEKYRVDTRQFGVP